MVVLSNWLRFISANFIFLCYQYCISLQRKLLLTRKIQDKNMNLTSEALEIIDEAYRSYRGKVCSYILYRINNVQEAEDLTQDVFVRLLEYGQIIRHDTVQNMIYTVARNLVVDYLRHHYCQQELIDYFMKMTSESSYYTESSITANDIAQQEKYRMSLLPPQRQKIYSLVRFEDKSVQDIAEILDISPRTVENHLLISRKEIRDYIKSCI